MTALALASLLAASGCAKTVDVEVAAAPSVDKRLMAPLKPVDCSLPADAADYPVEQVDAARLCEREGRLSAETKFTGLQRAVRVREQSTQAAVAAAKK